jgi:hypothetical protein
MECAILAIPPPFLRRYEASAIPDKGFVTSIARHFKACSATIVSELYVASKTAED